MRRRSIALTLLVLGMAACSTSGQSPKTTSTSSALEPNVYERPGPFAVGRQTLQLVDRSRANRSLAVDVWYPANRDAADRAARSKYVFVPGIEYPSSIAADNPPVASGSFPLVVYSHGSGGIRFVSSFLTESLASHGFIVVAADHAGNTALDIFLGAGTDEATTRRDRVGDVSFVITEMLAVDRNPAIATAIDAQRIGVIGHSLGGFTALMSAGGWESRAADPRVRAVVAMAPYTRTIPDAPLQKVNVATMLITGTSDAVTPLENDTTRPWGLVPGRPLYRVDVLDAGHQSFTDACMYRDLLPKLANVPPQFTEYVNANAAQGCGPGLLDIVQAHREITGYVTAFLDAYVAGNTDAAQALVSHPPLTTVQVKR